MKHHIVHNGMTPCLQFVEGILIFSRLLISWLKQEGESGVKKSSLAYIKVQPVIELLLFTESQNLRLWRKYGLSNFGGVAHSHTKYRGIKWPKLAIFDQYFQKYLFLSVQTCIKVRFYQFLHISVIMISRNVNIFEFLIFFPNFCLLTR